MRRRDWIKSASLAVGAMTAPVAWGADSASGGASVATDCDVLVVGGGSSGSIAAIAAARAGARTVLLEMGAQLGGTTTTAGVSYPGLFHAWGKQVIAGIGWNLVRAAVDLDDGRLPDFTKIPPRHSQHQVRINGPLYAALLEEALLAAGGQVFYYEFPRTIRPLESGWQAEVVGKGIDRRVTARQIVDCTGGADIAGMLGFARLREAVTQPGTMMFELTGYEPEKLDTKAIEARFRQALERGELKPGDSSHADRPFIGFLRSHGSNAQHIFGADSSTSATKTAANIAGRASVLRLLRFVRSLPGCQQARLRSMQTETGIRETYRIVGETQITVDDYQSGRLYDDAICHAFYPIDVHDEKGVEPKPLREGVVPTVPFGALVPKKSRNLLVAGRSLSSDRLANSALRVQATAMATGQAAGTAAALAAKRGVSPAQVPLADLRSQLVRDGAIVPGYSETR